MDTRTLAQSALDPLAGPADRLFRLRPEVYQGMLEHGLLTEGDGVELVDGLLVKASGNGSPTAATDRLYRISLELYHEMTRQGLLTEYDKIELLDGLLVTKMTKGDPHTTAVYDAVDSLRGVIPEGWHVKQEAPIALPGGPGGWDNEPEPDVSVIRGRNRDYRARKPGPADVALVVEVADSSVHGDRAKMRVYARFGISVAWLVNLVDGVIEVYTQPTGAAGPATYETVELHHPGDLIAVVIDGREIGRVAVNDILP